MKRRVSGNPPTNALNVNCWDDLPNKTKPAHYRIVRDGKRNRIVEVSKKRRRVLEGLMQRPVVSASRARISDKVLHLKCQNYVDIETIVYTNENDGEHGVYFLKCNVEYLGDVAPKCKGRK